MGMKTYTIKVIAKCGNESEVREGPYFGEWLVKKDAERVAVRYRKSDGVLTAKVIEHYGMG